MNISSLKRLIIRIGHLMHSSHLRPHILHQFKGSLAHHVNLDRL